MKLLHFISSLFVITHLHAIAAEEQVPKGLSKSDWSSIREAYDAGRHAFQKTNTGWQAQNPGQQWCTQFDGRGFVAEPKAGGWTWGLELQSYGFLGSENLIGGQPTIQASGQRLTYQWDTVVQEWFVNDGRGLEHGFTVATRPEAKDAPSAFPQSHHLQLAFTLATRGTLKPSVSADAQGVNFQDSNGATVLTYAGLKVWDADGKLLPSHFTSAENGVRLLVDEHAARYPITVDPIAQQAYVKASNSGVGDNFGTSVAISGNTVVVGAPYEDGSGIGVGPASNNLASDAGAAYVFVRSGGNWSQQTVLKASNTGANDNFGRAVAVEGDTIVVGAPYEDGSGDEVDPVSDDLESNAGAAYVFFRNGVTWLPQAYLKASNSGASDNFGYSVAVSGDIVVVGALYEDGGGVGVNPSSNNSLTDAGAAYVYVRSGAVWSFNAYLKAANPNIDDYFAGSVSVSGDTVVVGASGEDGSGHGFNPPYDDLLDGSGAAYVFVRSGATWSQQAYLKASNSEVSDRFGISLAVSADTLVVGANGENGSGVGVNPPFNNGAADTGAAYVFVRSGVAWSQQAYLKASNTGVGDYFGQSVAVSGDTLVVGAFFEDGSGVGVNPASDELASSAGAAYVFVRSNATWSQQAYLKASNTGANDSFGFSVAVSDGTVIGGSVNENGSSNGVNSGSDELAPEAGAAYIFNGLGPLFPEIAVERGGVNIATGDSQRFGAVNVGSSTDLSFILKNTSVVNLTLTATPNKVTVSGPDAAMFSIVTQPTSPVAPHTGTNFIARFTPTSSGTKTATLTILNDDTDEGTFTITLTGTVLPQEINVAQAAVDIASGGSRDFGNVSVGNMASLTFDIANIGGANLTLTNTPKVLVSGSDAAMFTVTNQPSATVIPGGGTSFIVRFAPTSGGAKSALLTIPNNDSDENPYLIGVTGTAPPQEITVEQAAVDIPDGGGKSFGGVIVGSTSDLTFTIRNTGGVNLTLNGSPRITVSGADVSMFTVTNAPAAGVSPGGNTSFTVHFAPTSGGAKSAALNIPNNDSDEGPFDINLSGNGLTFTMDTDGDGLSDASEAQLGSLGFDWQTNQTALVNTLFSNASQAGLYTTSQVQALNVDTPLLTKNPNGDFSVTIGLEKSTDLNIFTPFPMTVPQTTLDAQGRIIFQFTVPGNAAFFRVQAQ